MDITREELDERVAIVKKFRGILEEQREKFREYLTVLEKQHTKIEAGDSESVVLHSELSEKIVSSIGALQKVAAPMEALYKKTHGSDSYIPEIQSELCSLRDKVSKQNIRNQELLRVKMVDLQKDMRAFKNPYRTRSLYSSSSTASVIQMEV